MDYSFRLETQPWFNYEPDEGLYIVIEGSFIGGFQAVGPFQDYESAENYAESSIFSVSTVMALKSPKTEEIP